MSDPGITAIGGAGIDLPLAGPSSLSASRYVRDTGPGCGVRFGTGWNVTTSFTYDSHGRTATETGPNGRMTTSIYDDADRLITRIDNDVVTPTQADEDVTTSYFYDDAGRQAAVLRPLADGTARVVDRTKYDPATGRVLAQISNCTNTNEGVAVPHNPATCDGGGTPNSETNVTTTYAYDTVGNRTRVDSPDPAGGTTPITTRYAYDAANRLCRVLQNASPANQTFTCGSTVTGSTTSTNVLTSYGYDGVGSQTSMTDGRGKITTYAYDAAWEDAGRSARYATFMMKAPKPS